MKAFRSAVGWLTVDRRSALEVAFAVLFGYVIGYDAGTGKYGGVLFWLIMLPPVMLGTGFVNALALLALRLIDRRRP